MMSRLYLAYGLIIIGMMGMAEYRGWSLASAAQGRTAPRSVRDNPGSYRPVYGGFRHFTGGK
jgi:hypothetical protein